MIIIPGGWGSSKINIKDHLSPAEAETWSEHGNYEHLTLTESLVGTVRMILKSNIEIDFMPYILVPIYELDEPVKNHLVGENLPNIQVEMIWS